MPPRHIELIEYDIEFFIKWNAASRQFDIECQNGKAQSSAGSKAAAISIATKAARFEAREGKKVAVYSFNAEQKPIIEWSA